MWLARWADAQPDVDCRRFKALGAGDVAREVVRVLDGQRVSQSFQSPRCGRCGSRGHGVTAWHASSDVSKPSVRAMWLARWSTSTRSRSPMQVSKPSVRAMWLARRDIAGMRADAATFQSPRCGRCGSRGGIGSTTIGSVQMFQSPRCGRCGSRGRDAAVHAMLPTCVSKPSVRAMWLARWRLAVTDWYAAPGFKALGAGDVARE